MSEPVASVATPQNALVLSDMFSRSPLSDTSTAQPYPSPNPFLCINGGTPNFGLTSEAQGYTSPRPAVYYNGSNPNLDVTSPTQAYPSSPKPAFYSDGSIPNFGVTLTEQACPSPKPAVYSNGSPSNSGAGWFDNISYQGSPLNNGNLAWNGQVFQGMNLQQQPLNGKYAMHSFDISVGI